jgi:hypothetical protein
MSGALVLRMRPDCTGRMWPRTHALGSSFRSRTRNFLVDYLNIYLDFFDGASNLFAMLGIGRVIKFFHKVGGLNCQVIYLGLQFINPFLNCPIFTIFRFVALFIVRTGLLTDGSLIPLSGIIKLRHRFVERTPGLAVLVLDRAIDGEPVRSLELFQPVKYGLVVSA